MFFLETLYLLFLILFLVLFLSVALFVISIGWYIGRKTVPFVPSKKEDRENVEQFLKETNTKHLIDLGCGTGDVLLVAARKGLLVTGVEINPILLWACKARLVAHRIPKEKYTLIRADIKNYSPTENEDTIFVYLLPTVLETLKESLKERFPNKKIISNRFPIHEWSLVDKKGRLFLYTIPEKE